MKIEGRIENPTTKINTMKNNFLLINLEEKKSKTIAEAISNESARKILDFLGKKDATETEISKELKIPISTVHYNLKQLQEANLVTVEEFHYSEKGKEVNHYSLANKFIIIAPKSTDSKFMEALNRILPLAIITVIVAAVMQMISLLSTADTSLKSAPVMDAGVRSMAAIAPQAGGGEIARPLFQSNLVTYFLVGALAVIILYFIYEWVKKE